MHFLGFPFVHPGLNANQGVLLIYLSGFSFILGSDELKLQREFFNFALQWRFLFKIQISIKGYEINFMLIQH